jgi:hypothetical protein
MTNCTVLRCSSEAEAVLRPHPEYEPFALPVCGAHDKAIAAGVPWLLDGDMGVPVESGPPTAGVTIRMGADFPAVIQQTSLTRMTGHIPGLRLSFVFETHEGPSSAEFWMTEEQGRMFGEFFRPTPSDGAL